MLLPWQPYPSPSIPKWNVFREQLWRLRAFRNWQKDNREYNEEEKFAAFVREGVYLPATPPHKLYQQSSPCRSSSRRLLTTYTNTHTKVSNHHPLIRLKVVYLHATPPHTPRSAIIVTGWARCGPRRLSASTKTTDTPDEAIPTRPATHRIF
ncbi:hypothetical protein N658DRAFT_47502 [Parathielavia hyrcaniae]|uniref:Uncharacterized protein n=1 Tax=Parathielavia hyrcaniae TaxID=113614 RepID=A0AAN6PQR6_9PEZI|nr:hypothetical protein N658DRAFT_47502 [Parathielavia hyrcaniae]